MLVLYSIGFGYYIYCFLEWVEEYISIRFYKIIFKIFFFILILFKEFYWYYVYLFFSIIENICIYIFFKKI